MNDLNHILPREGLPATNFPPNTVQEWCDTDTPDGFHAHGGSDGFREHDIQYAFNSLGYRSPEFDAQADIRLLVIGCSYVMGVGLPQSALFHERFAERLRERTSRSVVAWNLSIPGASNDYIARLLFLAVPYLDPDLVLINFTHGSRREYMSVQNRLAAYTPSFRPPDLVGRDIWKHFDALNSPFDDQLNLYKNYKAIESLLAHRCWLFSTIDAGDLMQISHHLQMHRYAGNLITVDYARDRAHPGARSHEGLMECYWSRFVALDVPLSRLARPRLWG